MKQSTSIIHELTPALTRLNNLYGRGDIVDFDTSPPGSFDNADYTGRVYCKLQYGTERKNFRVLNGTLYFRGHQMKLRA